MNKDITEFKIELPLITLDETIALDNHLNEIVKEITELHLHDKDLALSQEIIKRLQERIDKAIEYINKQKNWLETEYFRVKLISILKGEPNDKDQ